MSGKATTYTDNITGQGYTAEEYVIQLLKDRRHLQAEVEFWKWVSKNYCYSQIKSKLEGKTMYYHISNQAPTKYYTEAQLREEFKRLKDG